MPNLHSMHHREWLLQISQISRSSVEPAWESLVAIELFGSYATVWSSHMLTLLSLSLGSTLHGVLRVRSTVDVRKVLPWVLALEHAPYLALYTMPPLYHFNTHRWHSAKMASNKEVAIPTAHKCRGRTTRTMDSIAVGGKWWGHSR